MKGLCEYDVVESMAVVGAGRTVEEVFGFLEFSSQLRIHLHYFRS